MSQARAALGNSNGFVNRFDIEHQISTNCFLRFSEWCVGNEPAVFAGNDGSTAFKRASRFDFALRSQSFDPSFVLSHEFLQLFVRIMSYNSSVWYSGIYPF